MKLGHIGAIGNLPPISIKVWKNWYLQNRKKRMDIAFAVKCLLTSSWAEDPSRFRNAQTWESNLRARMLKNCWLTYGMTKR